MQPAINSSLEAASDSCIAHLSVGEDDVWRNRCSLLVVGWIGVPALACIQRFLRLTVDYEIQPARSGDKGGLPSRVG